MNSSSEIVFLRYWGSHFKSLRQVGIFTEELRPMVKRGWKCYLVLERPPADAGWLQGLTDLGVTMVYAPRVYRNFDWKCVWRVWRLARRVRATIFHCDNMHTSPLIGAFLGGAKVRFWFKRAMNPEAAADRPLTFKEHMAPSLRLSCWLCTRVTALSKTVKDELVRLGIPARKILVRNNPLRLGAATAKVDRKTIRAGWGVSNTHTVIATLGWANRDKGWDRLLEAFTLVARKDANTRLILMGSYTAPGEQAFYTKLATFIRQEQLQDRVIFTGHVSDIVSALRASDLFVMASPSEGCANAPVEALECGLPCVLTETGHAAEIIQPGVNGYLVNRFDIYALAEAILKVTMHPDHLKELASRAKVPPHILNPEQYAKQLANDYAAALTEKRRRHP